MRSYAIQHACTHPQNSSTLSNEMTRLISSIHPIAAAAPGVCGRGVCGAAVIGVWGRFRPFVEGESNQRVHDENKGCCDRVIVDKRRHRRNEIAIKIPSFVRMATVRTLTLKLVGSLNTVLMPSACDSMSTSCISPSSNSFV